MATYLEARYKATPPQVLVALGPEALQFFVDHRESLFPGVPLIFGGTSVDELEQVRNLSEVAGLPMVFDLNPIVEAMLAMRPKTKEIVLVYGASPGDLMWREIALRQCARFQDRVKVIEFPILPLEELKARLASLPAESVVLYLTYFQGPDGENYTPAHVAAELASVSSVPLIGPYDTYIGSGVLGVCVSPFKEEGVVLGGVIRRVLAGESSEEIGILPPNPPYLIVDDRQIKRWGIRDIPAGAEVRFHTPTLWEEHRHAVVIALSVLFFQAILITGLVLARLRQVRAEKELRRSEALFSGVFTGSPAAMSIVRQSDGCIVDVNPEWEEATGMPRDEAIGRTPLEAGMKIGENAEIRFRLFLESGKPLHDYEQDFVTPDGRTRVLSVSTELITLQNGPCFIFVAKDVTDLREAEDARRQLAHASRLAMLGEMTASIAHEINQPLGAILSNTDAAEMMMEKSDPPLAEVRAILSDIRRDDRRASEVIKRVRALVGNRETRKVEMDLNGLLREALRMVRHEAQSRGVTLSHDLYDDLPPLFADAVQIEQVVLNLLLNAMDAMKDIPVASREIVVRSARRDGDFISVSVEDCGHGIPPELFCRLFDSFFTTKESGMGLGLSLARSIVEAHGGTIFAENKTSEGAVFTLILPSERSATRVYEYQ